MLPQAVSDFQLTDVGIYRPRFIHSHCFEGFFALSCACICSSSSLTISLSYSDPSSPKSLPRLLPPDISDANITSFVVSGSSVTCYSLLLEFGLSQAQFLGNNPVSMI